MENEDKNNSKNINNEDKDLLLSDVSVSMLDKLLSEYVKYAQRIKDSENISNEEYILIAKGVWGCMQIAKEILNNDPKVR